MFPHHYLRPRNMLPEQCIILLGFCDQRRHHLKHELLIARLALGYRVNGLQLLLLHLLM